jgi:hypothetical protein
LRRIGGLGPVSVTIAVLTLRGAALDDGLPSSPHQFPAALPAGAMYSDGLISRVEQR